MFCHKCGTQINEGSVFCPKCGAKLVSADTNQQPIEIPVPNAKGQRVSRVAENNQQADANDTAKANGGLRKAANIGRVLMCGSLVLLFLMSFLPLRINPVILVAGVAIGIILSAFGAKRPLGITKIIELVVSVILLVAVVVYFMSSSGKSDKSKDSSISTESDTRNDSNSNSKSTESDSQSGSNAIGKTQSYDNVGFGNMEVTLDNVQLTDRVESIFEESGYAYPDEGFVFLWATFTVENIGTVKGSLPPGWSKIVYDGTYEFVPYSTEGDFTDIPPLSAPREVTIIFMVPTLIMESDKSFAIIIGDGIGNNLVSYTIKPSDVSLETSGFSDQSEEKIFSYDATAGFSRPLEYYGQLSGLYEGSMGQSSLGISIYSSQEEGEIAIGTVGMYVDDEQYYLGEIIAEPEPDVYLVETDTGEEVVLDIYPNFGPIYIDLYVDGQYIDEYTMVEHYEP